MKTFEERIAVLNEKAKKINAIFEHNLYDKNHLSCFWYDDKNIITIKYKGCCICFDVCGDVFATLVCDTNINQEGFVEISHCNGAEPIYFNSEVSEILENDHDLDLHRLCHSSDFESNNWINVIIVDQRTQEPISEPYASDEDNLLVAVEKEFDELIQYVDEIKRRGDTDERS